MPVTAEAREHAIVGIRMLDRKTPSFCSGILLLSIALCFLLQDEQSIFFLLLPTVPRLVFFGGNRFLRELSDFCELFCILTTTSFL